MSGREAPKWWYEPGARVPMWARAVAPLYAALVALRARLYGMGLLRTQRLKLPVLVVGNLVAGGSGKTPLTIAIVERLRAEGWNPGVATRGYGRADDSKALWVEPATPPARAGDEPVLIARQTDVKVRVDRDRVAAARALAKAGCDIVVCDDGLQHYALGRDIEIEVIDGRRRHGNGLPIPAGPLREPVERGARCDFRVLNVGSDPDLAAGFGEWPMWLAPGEVVPLVGGRTLPLSAFAGRRVHAVAGIGDPERFFAMLRDLGIAVVPHAFPDHHAYTADDLRFGSDLPVLMTAKDAVKCAAFVNEKHYAVPVSAELPEAFWVALAARLPPSALRASP
ncbi:tetraacyldisaccharide 4'-kinase [Luteimonas arsenica]|uniref:tetraacyldisaccharide 4'-kinase n=1 Tax=Luteimonas arsenica TaxID=1586242 RepID=UPI001056D95C|nr:tetraacyldisaccharide 4'-kinase [Luteimonas arsenica]